MAPTSLTYRKMMELMKKFAPSDPEASFTSHDLRRIFRGEDGSGTKIDPKKKYPEYYSEEKPLCAITYPWGMDLRKHLPTYLRKYRAFVMRDTAEGHEKFPKCVEDLTFWMDIWFIDQNTNEIIRALSEAQFTYSHAFSHLVLVTMEALKRGWCLFEIAARLRAVMQEFKIDASQLLHLVESIGIGQSDLPETPTLESTHDWMSYSASFVAEKKLPHLIFVPGFTDEAKDLQIFCETSAIDCMVTGVPQDKEVIKSRLLKLLDSEETFNKSIQELAKNALHRFKEESKPVAELAAKVEAAREAREGGEKSKGARQEAAKAEVKAAEEMREEAVKELKAAEDKVAKATAEVERAKARHDEAMREAQAALHRLRTDEAAARAQLEQALATLHAYDDGQAPAQVPASVVHLPPGTILGADVLKNPFYVALDREGRIIVSDDTLHQVLVFSTDGTLARRFGSDKGAGAAAGQFNCPRGVAVDGQGRVVVADRDNHRIQVLNGDGSVARCFGSEGTAVGQLEKPTGVAVDRQGRIVVAEWCNHRIQVFNEDGSVASHFGSKGSAVGQLNEPYGVAVDGSGRIVVADCQNHRVQVYNSDGSVSLCFGSYGSGPGQLSNPTGVAVDKEGRFVVADPGNDRIQVFNSDGSAARVVGAAGAGVGQVKRPFDVAVDGAGRIIVAEAGGRGNHRVQLF